MSDEAVRKDPETLADDDVRKDDTAAITEQREDAGPSFDVNAYLKFQKDVSRQLKNTRDFMKKFEPQGEEKSQTDGSQGGLTRDELSAAMKYQRLVGGLDEDVQTDFDEMDGTYAEKVRAVQFYIKGMQKSRTTDTTPTEEVAVEPEKGASDMKTKKRPAAKPESPGIGASVPVIKNRQQFYKADKKDRERWVAAGNSPSTLPVR